MQCQTMSRPMKLRRNRKRERRKMEAQKDLWTEGKAGVKKLIEYVKKIGFYQGI
jgi:hypothetical protein